MTITGIQRQLLERLARCQPGKGLPEAVFTVPDNRVLGKLVIAGLVSWLRGGGLQVYGVTEKGRDVLTQLSPSASADETA